MAYAFGKGSAAKLEQGHPDLVKILNFAIGISPVDFGLSCVARTFDEQLGHFLAEPPRTSLDPRDPAKLKHAKHVTTPERPLAEAADIYIYHPDPDLRRQLAYDKPSLTHVAGVIIAAACILHAAGEVEHLIRWGGNWDKDGVILADQSFDDLPHVELVKP